MSLILMTAPQGKAGEGRMGTESKGWLWEDLTPEEKPHGARGTGGFLTVAQDLQ